MSEEYAKIKEVDGDPIQFYTTSVNNTIAFTMNTEFILKILQYGRIEKGPAFTTDDEASHKFLEILGETYQAALRAAHKRGMVEGIKISGEQLRQFGDDITAMAAEIEAKP